MSALFRPHGDQIATVYGSYKTKKEVKKIAKGDKLDILCSDGLNYHVEVKETGPNGRLHFRHWSVKHDYIGSFEELYLAAQGTYSEGISAQNTYPTLVKGDGNGEKTRSSSSSKSTGVNSGSDSRPQNFPSGTRYPEDFLSKPRFATSHSRKRPAEDTDDIDWKCRTLNSFEVVDDLNEFEVVLEDVEHLVKKDEEDVTTADVPHIKTRVRKSSSDKNPQTLTLLQNFENIVADAKGINLKQPSRLSTLSKKSVIEIPVPSSSPTLNINSAGELNTAEKVDVTVGVTSISSAESLGSGGATSPTFTPVLSQIETSVAPSLNKSTSNPTAAQQQVSRVIPAYQQQVQRVAQVKYLREILATDRCIVDTGRAIDIVTNHPIVFKGVGADTVDTKPAYTSKQLLELLQARRKIDEVIRHILLTL